MDKFAVQEYLTQGAVLAGQGKHAEALVYYDRAEKENPMDIDVYLSKGIALANLDKLNEAKAQFEKALKINKTSGLAHFHLGSIAILQGDQALGFENYNGAIANGYDDAQLYYSIGLLHEENGEIDMAIRNYSKAIMKDALRPDVRVRKARLLIQENHFPEALQALDEMILTNPDVFEGYHMKIMVLMQMNQIAKAEVVVNDALGLFPKDPGFAIDKVQIFLQQNRIDDAVALLNSLENAEETDDAVRRRIFMEKAQISTTKDNVEAAIMELEKAKKLSDKNGEFDAEVVFLLANCHLATEEYEKTLAEARELILKSNDDYYKQTARYFEPFAMKMLGRIDEAKALYTEVINEFRRQSLESPGNLDSYLLRTMCLRDLEQYEKALEILDYVITLQPERGEPRVLRVSVLEALSRTEEAAEEQKIVNSMLPEELRKK